MKRTFFLFMAFDELPISAFAFIYTFIYQDNQKITFLRNVILVVQQIIQVIMWAKLLRNFSFNSFCPEIMIFNL